MDSSLLTPIFIFPFLAAIDYKLIDYRLVEIGFFILMALCAAVDAQVICCLEFAAHVFVDVILSSTSGLLEHHCGLAALSCMAVMRTTPRRILASLDGGSRLHHLIYCTARVDRDRWQGLWDCVAKSSQRLTEREQFSDLVQSTLGEGFGEPESTFDHSCPSGFDDTTPSSRQGVAFQLAYVDATDASNSGNMYLRVKECTCLDTINMCTDPATGHTTGVISDFEAKQEVGKVACVGASNTVSSFFSEDYLVKRKATVKAFQDAAGRRLLEQQGIEEELGEPASSAAKDKAKFQEDKGNLGAATQGLYSDPNSFRLKLAPSSV